MSNTLFYTAKSGAVEKSTPAMRNASVWIFGRNDICAEDKSWAINLTKEGFYDFLAVGTRASNIALGILRKFLATEKPLYVIWDIPEKSEKAIVEVISVCKINGVTPILVAKSGAAHSAVNEFIAKSGERCIDLSKISVRKINPSIVMAKVLVDFPEIISPKIPVRIATTQTLNADNNKVSIGLNRVKDGKHLVFSAKVDKLRGKARIAVGHGYYISYGKWFEITSKNLEFYSYTSWNETPLCQHFVVPHGLKIKGNITVVIGADNDNLGNTVTIITEGGCFTKRGYGWNACDGEVCAMAHNGAELSDAKLSWTCVDYPKAIWLLGASYFSLSDPARWPYYLYADKYDKNVFMAGRGGMGGPHGIQELKDAISSGFAPKALAWGVGMNDGSDEGDIKPAYYSALCELMQVCKEHGIMLYVMTIPQTPKQNNSYKLDYLLNKKGEFAKYDYRVIDIARSINAHEIGSSWYEGMIHTDQTHPTPLGARAFYLQFLCDFPELMVGGGATRVEKTAADLPIGDKLTIGSETPDVNEYAFTLSCDFEGELSGKITLGGENEGETYVTVDKNHLSVYVKAKGEGVLIAKVKNNVKMLDLMNIRIHAVGNKANIALMSAGENVTMKKHAISSIETYWSTPATVAVTADGMELKNLNAKIVNN